MASSTSSREACFRAAVNSVVSNWTALRLMVNNSSVGDAFVPWLVDATVQWFSDNADLAPEEVEGFFEDIIVAEFNVSLEDGSLREIGTRVWELYGDCGRLREEEVMAKLGELPKASDLSACRVEDAKEVEVDSEENGGDGGGAAADDGAMDVEENSGANASVGSRREKPQTDEDGWTTVPSRRKR